MFGNLNPFNRPIITKTVNKLVGYGADCEASDIQLEIIPDSGLAVSYKNQGQPVDELLLATPLATDVFNKIKHLAGLKAKQTAGVFSLPTLAGSPPIAAALIKTSRGEILHLKLAPASVQLSLADLALNEEQARLIGNSLAASGLIVISGPPRSGKTATALAYLRDGVSPALNVYAIAAAPLTSLSEVHQIPVKNNTARAWERAMAAVAKQDADIIYLDEPPAGTDLQPLAALSSGKIIIISLTAASNQAALNILGEAKLYSAVAEAKFNLLINQRLARRLCPHCSFGYNIDEKIFADLNSSFEILDQDLIGLNLFHAQGCAACGHSGYFGLINLWEMVKPPANLSRLLTNGNQATAAELLTQATTISLTEDGFIKALQGFITVEELKHATRNT